MWLAHKMRAMNIVDRLVEQFGSQAALARELGISQPSVSDWRTRGRVPAERVLDLERLSGVPRHDIRPDLYPPTVETARD